MQADEALTRLRALGFAEDDALRLRAHFTDAEARGKLGHGYSRIEWLETLELDPAARTERIEVARLRALARCGALGYLVLDASSARSRDPRHGARVVVCESTFRRGCSAAGCATGRWRPRRGAHRDLAARLAHPTAARRSIGTTPLAIGS